jgi:hypothetical protein
VSNEVSPSTRLLAWSTLLSHWTRFAQSALALPTDGEGGRLRAAVPSIINLQAVTFALAELGDLPEDEYTVGQDRAEVLIRGEARTLHTIWSGEPLPRGIEELLDDARAALAITRENGVEAITTAPTGAPDHAAVAGVLLASRFDGDVWLLTPGISVNAGLPIAFLRGRSGRLPRAGVLECLRSLLPTAETVRAPRMRQVYRRMDARDGAGDVAAPMNATLEAGRPLLIPLMTGGVREG